MAKKDSSVSEYMKIRQYVVGLILRTKGGSVQLPTLAELSEKFEVSAPTVCKALKTLSEDGYIVGKRGLGTFTNPNFRFGFSSPLQKTDPVVGILIGDGMHIHYGMYETRIFTRTMEYLTMLPALVRLVSLSSGDPEKIIKDIRNERLDALVWYNPSERCRSEVLPRFAEEKFPLVVTGTFLPGIPSVDFDFEEASYRAGKMLIAENRRNVVFFPDVYPWTRESKGLRRAYQEAGIVLNENLFLKEIDTAHEKIREMLNYGVNVDAIFEHMPCLNELEYFLMELDPDFHKKCVIVAPGIAMPPVTPIRRFQFVEPFDDYGKTIAQMIRNSLNGSSEAPYVRLNIPIELI